MEKQERNVLNFHFRSDEAGSTMHVDSNMSAMDMFSRFFTNDLLLLRKNHMQLELDNRVLTWLDVTTDEMKVFKGILILMVICRLPRLRVY